MRHISSHLILTPCGLESGKVVTLSGEGTIVDISTPVHLDREAGVEFLPGVLVPGFFNAHCHLELSHLRRAISAGGGLTGFARGMRAARNNYETSISEVFIHGTAKPENPRALAQPKITAAEFWDAKMWGEGVSVAADICNGASTFGLKTRSRIRYRNFCELFGLGAEPEHRRRIFDLRNEALATGLNATVTPHSTYSLNGNAFAAAVDDKTSPPLSIHFLESEEEVDLFKKRGPLWDWYAGQGLVPDFLDYGGPAERLVAQVPPDRPVMLIHNTVATQRDIDIVMGHFTAPVTWVVCPGSNDYISGLTPPVDLLRKNHLKIAIGTDSLASNDTLSMVGELSRIKGVPLDELLGWVAADTIETGHTPGLVLITGVDLEKMALTPAAKTQRII